MQSMQQTHLIHCLHVVLYMLAILSAAYYMYIDYPPPLPLQEESVHGNLAYAVANAVLSDPTSTDVRVYTRSLSQMTFTPANQVGAHHHTITPSQPTPPQSNAGGLLELCEQMTREVTDKISLKYIDKLRECLIKSYPSHQGN